MAITKFIRIVNGVPTMQTAIAAIVNNQVAVVSTITALTNYTLPNSMTYDSDELEIRLNGQKLELTQDYTYVGTTPRTQVQFTQDIVPGDQLTFRTDRIP